MKFTIFLLMASVLARHPKRTFYAKVNGIYNSLSIVDTPEHKYVALGQENLRSIPYFHLVNDIAYTGHGTHTKYFGQDKGDIVYGVRSKVTPFNVTLDSDHKVKDLTAHLCTFNGSTFLGYLKVKKMDAPFAKCTQVDIYFLTVDEVKTMNAAVIQSHDQKQ